MYKIISMTHLHMTKDFDSLSICTLGTIADKKEADNEYQKAVNSRHEKEVVFLLCDNSVLEYTENLQQYYLNLYSEYIGKHVNSDSLYNHYPLYKKTSGGYMECKHLLLERYQKECN